MATYVFKATDLAGIAARGEVEANSKQDVAEQLKERGLVAARLGAAEAAREDLSRVLELIRCHEDRAE